MPLTEEDRIRIREEMVLREEIQKALAAASSTKKGVLAFLNSPFFLTVVAGIALSLLSHRLVDASADKERMLAQERSNREKLASIITAAANDLSTYMSMKGSWKKEKIWLHEHQGEDEKRLGRSREEVYKDYHEHWKMMMQARKPEAVFAEIRSFFCGDEVTRLAGKLGGAIETLGDAKTEDSVEPLAKENDKIFEALIGAMGEELRKVNSREPPICRSK